MFEPKVSRLQYSPKMTIRTFWFWKYYSSPKLKGFNSKYSTAKKNCLFLFQWCNYKTDFYNNIFCEINPWQKNKILLIGNLINSVSCNICVSIMNRHKVWKPKFKVWVLGWCDTTPRFLCCVFSRKVPFWRACATAKLLLMVSYLLNIKKISLFFFC